MISLLEREIRHLCTVLQTQTTDISLWHEQMREIVDLKLGT